MRQRQSRRGFTIVEVAIATTLLAMFLVFAFVTIANTQRVSTLEDIRLDMDRAANNALHEISAIVKDAYLPVRSFNSNPVGKAINDSTRGFGSRSILWERALLEGMDLLPFCQPVNLDGSGDLMDADLLPYFGVVRSGIEANDAGYSAPSFSLPSTASLSPGLASVTPAQLTSDLPADLYSPPPGAYGIVRFVPYVDNDGNNVVLTEAGLNCDFNRDGLFTTDRYLAGDLEIFYPAVTVTVVNGVNVSKNYAKISRMLGTRHMVIVPEGANTSTTVPPIFTLVSMDRNSGGLNPYNSSTADADLRFDALRIRFTMLNALDQTRGGSSKYNVTGENIVLQTYETIVRLRNQ